MFVFMGVMFVVLNIYGNFFVGVWFCFIVFNMFRLFFGLCYYFFDGLFVLCYIDVMIVKFEVEIVVKVVVVKMD